MWYIHNMRGIHNVWYMQCHHPPHQISLACTCITHPIPDPLSPSPNTHRWLAPEVLRGGPFHTAADVYGFGLVLWELMTWEVPWQGANPLQIVLAVADRGQRPAVPAPAAVPGGPPLQYDEFVSLMCDCWAQDPVDRPSFEGVIHRLRVLLQAEGGPG